MALSEKVRQRIADKMAQEASEQAAELKTMADEVDRLTAIAMNICPFCGADLVDVKRWFRKNYKKCALHGRVDD